MMALLEESPKRRTAVSNPVEAVDDGPKDNWEEWDSD